MQVQQGVVFRTYEVRVDRMTVLRGNMTEEATLFANLAFGATPVISVVIFRSAFDAPKPFDFRNVNYMYMKSG